MLDSYFKCNIDVFDQGLGGRFDSETFFWCRIDSPCHFVDVISSMSARLSLAVSVFSGHVAPHDAVCVLDGTTLPGRMRITEEDLNAGFAGGYRDQ